MAGFLSPITVKDNSTHYCYEQINIFQLVCSHRKRAPTLEGEADIRAADTAEEPKRGGKEKIGQRGGFLGRGTGQGWRAGGTAARVLGRGARTCGAWEDGRPR